MYKRHTIRLLTICFAFLLFKITTHAQVTIRGQVMDVEGQPLQGANVQLEGTPYGTSTNRTGQFALEELTLPTGTYSLRISFVGFFTETQTLSVTERNMELFVEKALEVQHYSLEALPVISPVVKEAPFPTEVVREEELNQHNFGQSMPFLLRWTPSAVVTSDAGTGIGYTGMRIRGSDATRTNVTINGVPLNDAESQGTFWVNLPDFAASVNEVRIQRGVGNSTNGAGSFGAGLHVTTLDKRPDERGFARLSNAYGSFDTWKNSLSFGTGLMNERFSVEGRLSRITSNGFIDRAEADLLSYYLSGTYWGEKTQITALAFGGRERTYQAWFGVPAQFVDDEELRTFNPAGQRSSGGFHENQVDNYTQLHHQLHWKQDLPGDWSMHLAGHYTRGEGYFEEYKDKELEAAIFSPEADFDFYGLNDLIIGGDTLTSTDLVRRRWLDNHFYGTVFSFRYDPSLYELTIGGAASHYDGRHFGELIWTEFSSGSEQGYTYYDADADKTDANIYTKLSFPLSPQWYGFADVQYRFVDYEWENLDDNQLNAETFHFFNPKVGVNFRPRSSERWYASVAMVHREPGRFDFLDADPGQQPRPERLIDWEIGYERVWSRAEIAINGFYMDYQDQLALTGEINQDALPVRVNIPNSYRVGVELSGRYQLDRLQLEGSFSASRNKIEAFTEFVDNWATGEQQAIPHEETDLAFSPNLIGHAVVGYTLIQEEQSQLQLSVLSKYVGRQYIDNTQREAASIDPYFFSDVRLEYTLQPGWLKQLRAYVLVRNLWDARFATNAWNYRFLSPGFDPREGDPYAQQERGDVYNLTGFFPQAGRNVMVGLELDF